MITKNKTAIDYINMKSGNQYEDVFFAGTAEELINKLQQIPFISVAGINKYVDVFYDNNEPGVRMHLMLNLDDIESVEFSEKDPEATAIAGRIIDLSEILKNATTLRVIPDAEESETCECCAGCGDLNPSCERERLEDEECECCNCKDCEREDIKLNAHLVTFGMIMPRIKAEKSLIFSPEAESYFENKLLAAVETVMNDFCELNEKYNYGSGEAIADLVCSNTTDIVIQELRKIDGMAFPIQNINLFKDEDAFAKAIGKNVIDEIILG